MNRSCEKKPREVKLYFNDRNHKAAEIWQWCRENNIPCSEYFNMAAVEKFKRDYLYNPSILQQVLKQEKEQKNEEVDHPKSFVQQLIDIATEYEEKGIDGADISYKLPYMYSKGQISKEQMAYIILFAQKLKITIDETGNFAEILDEYPIDSKRDIQNKPKMDQFKKILQLKLTKESDKLKKEKKKLEDQARLEDYIQKKKKEAEEWNKQHPDKPFWTKDLTDEEYEVELKIESGEYKVLGINYFPEDEEEEENLPVQENRRPDNDGDLDFFNI